MGKLTFGRGTVYIKNEDGIYEPLEGIKVIQLVDNGTACWAQEKKEKEPKFKVGEFYYDPVNYDPFNDLIRIDGIYGDHYKYTRMKYNSMDGSYSNGTYATFGEDSEFAKGLIPVKDPYNISEYVTQGSRSSKTNLINKKKEVKEMYELGFLSRNDARIALNSVYGIDAFNYEKGLHSTQIPEIKNVIFNPPLTIVIWADGSKTFVKATGEDFDPEKGLAIAISKKALGDRYSSFTDEFNKWTENFNQKEAKKLSKKSKED